MTDSICVGCGLCCDGTLFKGVLLEADADVADAASLGFAVERTEARTFFPQPCRAFDGGCCSVYAQRPSPCQDYRCALLIAHEDQGLTTAEAEGLIRQAGSLRDRVRTGAAAALGADVSAVSMAEVQRRLHVVVNAEDRRRHDELLLDLAALDVVLQRHFRKPSDGESALA